MYIIFHNKYNFKAALQKIVAEVKKHSLEKHYKKLFLNILYIHCKEEELNIIYCMLQYILSSFSEQNVTIDFVLF